MQRLRVLLISDYATPTGGAELMLLALRHSLRNRGHDVRILSSSGGPPGFASAADYTCFGIASLLRGMSQVANPSAYLKLARVLRDFRPDVVHVRLFLSQLSPLILPLLSEVPALYHVAWYRCICPVGTKTLPDWSRCAQPAGIACLSHGCVPVVAWPATMLQMKMWRGWSGAFNRIVANSHATKARLEKDGVGPAQVVWNGVPQTLERETLSVRPTVVFAGRLVPEKGVDILLAAFARVLKTFPTALLLIAGDGPDRSRIADQINDLNLSDRVSLTGHLSRQQMEVRFRDAWVQVVPSQWEEPFGLVAAEAMMRGTAVIASNTGGLAEIIDSGKTGILVPPRDVESLEQAILSILEDREWNKQLGRAGRAFALRYLTEETCVDRFLEIYREMVTTQSRGSFGTCD